MKRFLLLHINTGPFWGYGVCVFALGFSLSRFWVSSTGVRYFVSALVALAAAFFLPSLVRALFGERFRNRWMDNYVVITLILIAWIVSESFHDVQMRPEEALTRIVTRVTAVLAAGAISYAARRDRKQKRRDQFPGRAAT
jgi:hypothetical protein